MTEHEGEKGRRGDYGGIRVRRVLEMEFVGGILISAIARRRSDGDLIIRRRRRRRWIRVRSRKRLAEREKERERETELRERERKGDRQRLTGDLLRCMLAAGNRDLMLSLSLSYPFYLSVSVCLSVCLSVFVSISLYLCLYLFLSLSLCFSLSLPFPSLNEAFDYTALNESRVTFSRSPARFGRRYCLNPVN